MLNETRSLSCRRTTLQSWGFLDDYNTYRQGLVYWAIEVYHSMCELLGGPPGREQYEEYYADTLYSSPFFKSMALQKPNLPFDLYETCAHLLAELVIEESMNFCKEEIKSDEGTDVMHVGQALQKAYVAADKTLLLIERNNDTELGEHFASRCLLLLAQKYEIVSRSYKCAPDPIYEV